MSPIDMSREIVESLTDNEYIRKKLHTIICHELTAEQIKELYNETKTTKDLNIDIHRTTVEEPFNWERVTELYNETKTLTKIKEGTGQMVLPLH